MLQLIEKQTKSLQRIEALSKESNIIQLGELYEQRRIDQDGDRVENQLIELNKNVKERLNSNVIQLFEETKKQTKATKDTLRAITKDEAKGIVDTSKDRREFRTVGVRIDDFKEELKDFFTLRGFLDKTGIAERGSGGIVSEYLDRAEERKKYVDARMQVDPTKNLMGDEKARETFARQFNEQQAAQRAITKNEREIQKIADAGFRDDQIERSQVFKNRIGLATDLAKVDTRVRPQGFDAKTGMVREKAEQPAEIERESTSAASLEESTAKEAVKINLDSLAFQEIATKNSMSLPQIARDINVARQNLQEMVRNSGGSVKTGADAQFRKSSENESLMMVDKDKRLERMQEEGGLSFATSGGDITEEGLEAARAQEKQLDVLEKIEVNTRGVPGEEAKPEGNAGSGFLDNIFDFLSKGFMTAIKAIFNPRNILKAVGKFFIPAMIIGSLVNGIYDGFKAFFNGASLGEALIAGLGGILEFLTFGLLDAESIKSVVTWIGNAFDEYIIDPLISVFTPVVDFFKSIKDQLVNFVQNFGIPEFGFTIPIINKKVSIGPFYPFRSNNTMAEQAADSEPSKVAKVEGKDDGTKVTTFEDGGRKEEGAFGTKTYDKDGKLVSEKTPTFAGTSTEKFADGSQAKTFQKDGLKYKEILDKDGNVVREAAAMDLGATTVNREVRGSDLRPEARTPMTGSAISAQSAENESARMAAGTQGSTIVAPTTNVVRNSTTAVTVRPPSRNPDSTYNRFIDRAYA